MREISVVVPLFNHARYIEAALESVLNQTRAVDEIIVLDDGSSDNGFELAQRVLQSTPNTKVLRQTNAGAHITINRLIETTTKDYVAVLNSDDCFLPWKIEACHECLDTSSPDLIFGKVAIFDQEGELQDQGITVEWLKQAVMHYEKSGRLLASLLQENFAVSTSNMVFSKEIWKRLGGFKNLRYCHDLDFIAAACCAGEVEFQQLDHILYRVHERNTIKEVGPALRVEIAAVVANAILRAGSRLAKNASSELDFEAMYSVLVRKNPDQLVGFLMGARSAWGSDGEFYDWAVSPGRFDSLLGTRSMGLALK